MKHANPTARKRCEPPVQPLPPALLLEELGAGRRLVDEPRAGLLAEPDGLLVAPAAARIAICLALDRGSLGILIWLCKKRNSVRDLF